MKERILRMDIATGQLEIIALEQAVSELSSQEPFCEIAGRLREGEAVHLSDGRSYRAISALSDVGADQVPTNAVN